MRNLSHSGAICPKFSFLSKVRYSSMKEAAVPVVIPLSCGKEGEISVIVGVWGK